MRVGAGRHVYEWTDGWPAIPNADSEEVRDSHSHHGIVVTEGGAILFFHQPDPSVLVYDRHGKLQRSWKSGLVGAHGMLLTKEGDTEYLWMADATREAPAVVKTTLDGQVVMTIAPPDLPVYREGVYRPTSVAVNEERHGGNGDIWVADGYGESYVHRFDRRGSYLDSINGEEGEAGAFRHPHGIWVDTRKPERELYIADRTNKRVQVYDLDGGYKRLVDFNFTSPSGFAQDGELLIVIELRAKIVALDIDDRFVFDLGANESIAEVEGWPNVPRSMHEPGKLVAPHGIATDSDGNLYVAEWLKGGRITRLAKV